MDTNIITATLVPEDRRLDITAKLFGIHFPLAIEPAIFTFASRLSPEYNGGYWDFYELSNGGFYMAPDAGNYTATSENGWRGTMSGEAFGITACLYAYSNLSFSQRDDLAELCGRHYHFLREYMLEHAEVKSILAAID
jgi:hypothetical protein